MRIQNHKPECIAPIGLLIAGLLMTACQTSTTQASTTTGSGQSGAAQAVAAAPAATPTALPSRYVATTTSVAADGALTLATPLVSATFDATGKVTAVHAVPGQTVKKGDVLAELDPSTLNIALQKAQESLTLQKAQIALNLAPAKQTDIDNSKGALNSAYAAYNELKSGPTASTVEQALRTWNQAKDTLYNSQLGRDTTCGLLPGASNADAWKLAMGNPKCKQSDLGVQVDELKERSAYQAYLTAQEPASQTDLTKSWAAIVQAQSSLATLQNGVSDQQKVIYDLQLKQVQIAVERAQRNLQQAKLVSPCNCVVQEVTLSVGAAAGSGSGVTLLDLSQITFQTSNLNERDVVAMKSGLPATIRLKAFTGTITGTVDAVLPVSSGTLSTVALYTVILHLDPTGTQSSQTTVDLRPGMTGQAEINVK